LVFPSSSLKTKSENEFHERQTVGLYKMSEKYFC